MELVECYETLKYELIKPNGHFNSTKNKSLWAEKHYPEIWRYVIEKDSKIETPVEFIWLYEHDFKRRYCLVCGNCTDFASYARGYKKFCSKECYESSSGKNAMSNILKQGRIEKLGCACPFDSKEVQEKIKKTNLEKYGHECCLSNPDIQEKRKQTNIERYGTECPLRNDKIKEKRKQTLIDRYGVENPMLFTEVKERVKHTNVERYGVEWCMSNKDTHDKRLRTMIDVYGKIDSAEIVEKILKTKRSNGTFNKSINEERLYQTLLHLGYEVIRQYRSEAYPFNCDFYLPELDIYIEYQGSQYHHGRPFDNNNEDDIKELKRLESCSNNLKSVHGDKCNQYDEMIKCWTVSDVKKRTIAINNNVSLLELYNIPDNDTLKELISKVSTDKTVYQYC